MLLDLEVTQQEVRDSENRKVLKLAGESYFNVVFLSPYNSPVNRALVCLL